MRFCALKTYHALRGIIYGIRIANNWNAISIRDLECHLRDLFWDLCYIASLYLPSVVLDVYADDADLELHYIVANHRVQYCFGPCMFVACIWSLRSRF